MSETKHPLPHMFHGVALNHTGNFTFYHHNTNKEPVRIPARGRGGVERALTLLHKVSWYLVMRVKVGTTGNFS